MITYLFLLNLIYFVTSSEFIVDPGPKVTATKGAVWPKPKNQITSDEYSVIRSSLFQFQVNSSFVDKYFLLFFKAKVTVICFLLKILLLYLNIFD